ncbi:hypothetical protein Prudu_262S000700, partial [Prunus dulcis]
NLGIPLAPLRRARRKESVDTEWARIGVVTKKLWSKESQWHNRKYFETLPKRAADFQKVLAPPPSSNCHGTGGVGTAIESPTFSNRPQPRGRPDLAGTSCFPTEVRPKLPKLPARNSPSFLHQIDRPFIDLLFMDNQASEVQPISMRKLQRATEVRGIHHRASHSFRTTK